ncbi:MAG: chemotaxis protein CheB [Campylobacterota bacterium]
MVVIGASTGGPKHIEKIIKSLPGSYEAAVVIAQHMDNQYIPSFVKRLDSVCALEVRALAEDERLQANRVYVCSSICKLEFARGEIFASKECQMYDYNPSINNFFQSVATLAQKIEVLSIILTGIGADGALGMQAIVQNGGKAVVESAQSAIVNGMPLRAKELNPQAQEQSLDEIIETVLEFGS